jgi:hypothetical protein
MDLLNLWIPLIGGGILIAIAISAWFSDQKVISIWFGFAGAVLLLFLGAVQIQEIVTAAPTEHKEIVQIPGIQAMPVHRRASVIVMYSDQAPEVTDLPFGKGLKIKFSIRNIGDSAAIVKSIVGHVYLAEMEPDLDTAAGQATKEDFITGGPYNHSPPPC